MIFYGRIFKKLYKNMNFKEYQEKCKRTAKYPKIGENFVYPALGLAGESGEVLEKVKKIFRDNNGQINDKIKIDIKKEIGDVLWYLSQLATELDLSFDEVATENINKLASRLERGKIQGDGDNR